MSRIWVIALLSFGYLFGQVSSRVPSDYKLYALHSSSDDEQWCAYRDLDNFKAEVQKHRASDVATLTFSGGAVTSLYINSVDETGDWGMDETYRVDGKGDPVALTRTIRVRDGQIDESWLIKNGKAVKQPSLRTAPKLEFVPKLPVITDLRVFPFWALVLGNQRKILSGGMACTAESGPPDRNNGKNGDRRN